MSGRRGVHGLGLGQAEPGQAEPGQACGQHGAVEELPVPGAGRPGFRWGCWTLGQGQAGERPDLQLSTPSSLCWTGHAAFSVPRSPPGCTVWKTGPEPTPVNKDP